MTFLLCLACLRSADAEVVLIPALRDNVLYESSEGTLSNGQGEFLFAGRTNQVQNSTRRSVVRFDVAAHLPPTATVVAAELRLYLDRTSSSLTETAGIHRVLRDWGEGASKTLGGGGGGGTAEMDDATWLHTFYDSSFWSAPGGDFLPQASASLAVDTSHGYKTWTSASLTQDAADFFAHPETNFGWIVLGNESAPGSVRKFASRNHLDSALHPVLRLYVVGDCPIARTGDVNADYQITASDIIVLVNFVFKAGSAPLPCTASGDVNCSSEVTSSDIIYLVNDVFRAGPVPCDVCALIPAVWTCP